MSKRIKSAVLTSFALAITACTSTVPNNTVYKENFQDSVNEYSFGTKVLTDSYIVRMFQTWLSSNPVNGAAIVKEIAYARTKYPLQLIRIMTSEPLLLAAINNVQVVKDRAAADSAFSLFLKSCESAPSAFAGEFQVNTYSTYHQAFPAVAMDNDGDFVVAWKSRNFNYGEVSQDGSDYGIFAQRYNSAGAPKGSEFQVNTYTTGDQLYPVTAMDNDGDFVVAWVTYNQDGYYSGVFAQRYNSAGARAGTEFLVNNSTYGYQTLPAVAMDSDGDFVITWFNNVPISNEASNLNIYARRYNKSGQAQGTEFKVNTNTSFYKTYPSVAMDDGGDFVISWTGYSQDGDASNETNIYAQRYNSAGSGQGSEFKVNTFTSHLQFNSSAAMDSDGDFVITWMSSYNKRYMDTPYYNYYYGILGQRYNAAGAPQGSEFIVSIPIDGVKEQPSVAMDSAGDFVVSWHGYGYEDRNGVYAHRFNSSGAAQGSEFRVNTYITGYQQHSSVAMDNAGDFVVAWHSLYQDDSLGYGVFAKRYNSNGVEQ